MCESRDQDTGLFLGCSPQTQAARAELDLIAGRRTHVLICGETGVGKDAAARYLHEQSAVQRGPFVAVNCAAFVDSLAASEFFGHVKGAFTGADQDRLGAFREAAGGTLCLEEIGELTPRAQALLLRALHTRRIRPVGGRREFSVNVRVVATTHRDLPAMGREGTFRLDLYHRLAKYVVRLAPLRERPRDLVCLAEHLRHRIGEELGASIPPVSDEALAALRRLRWTGNVRELENVLAAASIYDTASGAITPTGINRAWAQLEGTPADATVLAPSNSDRPPKGYTEPERELSFLEQALERCNGNITRAARLAGMHRNGFRNRLRRLQHTRDQDTQGRDATRQNGQRAGR